MEETNQKKIKCIDDAYKIHLVALFQDIKPKGPEDTRSEELKHLYNRFEAEAILVAGNSNNTICIICKNRDECNHKEQASDSYCKEYILDDEDPEWISNTVSKALNAT